jgi:hypothetical protein
MSKSASARGWSPTTVSSKTGSIRNINRAEVAQKLMELVGSNDIGMYEGSISNFCTVTCD